MVKKKCPYCGSEHITQVNNLCYICKDCYKTLNEEKVCKSCVYWRPYKSIVPWGDCMKFCHPENTDPLYTQADDECHKRYDGLMK